MRTVGAPAEIVASIRTEPWWPGTVSIAHTLAHNSEAMDDRQGAKVPLNLLAAVEAPTLVLCGDQSPPWMLDAAREVAGRWGP